MYVRFIVMSDKVKLVLKETVLWKLKSAYYACMVGELAQK